MSRDGKHVAMGSGAGQAHAIVWNRESGEKLQLFQHRFAEDDIRVALSHNGEHLATATSTKAFVGSVADGKKSDSIEVPHPEGGFVGLRALAIGWDGKTVLTGHTDGKAILWGAGKIQTVAHEDGPMGAYGISGVALSDNGKQIWTACLDGSTRLWDATTGKERCRLYSLDDGKEWLVVAPNGSFDGSDGAWRFVTYRVRGTQKLIDDDATQRRFHRPGLLKNSAR